MSSQTNSMEQIPFSEASSFSSGQEIFYVLWNANGHYIVHKRRFFRIFSHINPVNAPPPFPLILRL